MDKIICGRLEHVQLHQNQFEISLKKQLNLKWDSLEKQLIFY